MPVNKTSATTFLDIISVSLISLIPCVMFAPIFFAVKPIIHISTLVVFALLIFQLIAGIGLRQRFIKHGKRKLAVFCLICGLVPVGWVGIGVLGMLLGLWY